MHERYVKVIIDRPQGCLHPQYPDLYYPVNYGYVEGVFAADGEEQDAYILGVDEPLDVFVGNVIAVIRREDDVEDKWVVAQPGASFTAEEIRHAVLFQEQYFRSTVILLDK